MWPPTKSVSNFSPFKFTETGPLNSPDRIPFASAKPSNLRDAMSLRSRMARGEKIFCSAATISDLRWSMPSEEICTPSASSYLSTIRPLKKSLSAFTTRNEVAPGRCFCRTASAVRMRSSKNFSSTSTRSGESTRTTILDFELKKPVPMSRWRGSLTWTSPPSRGGWVTRRISL